MKIVFTQTKYKIESDIDLLNFFILYFWREKYSTVMARLCSLCLGVVRELVLPVIVPNVRSIAVEV